jgi:ribonuclease HII
MEKGFPGKRALARLSIADIEDLVNRIDTLDDAVLSGLKGDGRAGVRALARKLVRSRERDKAERDRLAALAVMEEKFRAEGSPVIAGVDEAGRGPLAGPVVAAAVVLPEGILLTGLNDSKALSPERREDLFDRITAVAVAWGVGIVDNEEIDFLNILQSSLKAMRIAIGTLGITPDLVLVDGDRAPRSGCREYMVVDGDARCQSIAAASIIAKVTRDRIMVELDGRYPLYGFAAHKGYCAPTHVSAIREHGPCALHRFSFGIVVRESPPGRVAALLESRIAHAATRHEAEMAADVVAGLREFLTEPELAALRTRYLARLRALG